MKPIYFTRAQVSLMLEIAAICDPEFNRRFDAAWDKDGYYGAILRCLSLRQEGSAFQWQPR
jgi:hypothetical protein